MLLIDGYNLLHVTDLFGEGGLAGTLRGSREALLAYIAARLPARERKRTTIVFDAAGAPPGLPAEQSLEGIRVLFARGYADADAMLEALIEQARAPKSLCVVSGDRRVQRAARQRGAAWVESRDWFQELRGRKPLRSAGLSSKGKPVADVGDAAYWIEKFSQDLPQELPESEPPAPRSDADSGTAAPSEPAEPRDSPENPFPPGYADDLAEELAKPYPRHGKPE